jgi:hypothetical protein
MLASVTNSWGMLRVTGTVSSFELEVERAKQRALADYYTTNIGAFKEHKVPAIDLDVTRRQYALACAKHDKREMKRLERLIANNQ